MLCLRSVARIGECGAAYGNKYHSASLLQVFQITSYWRMRFKRQNRTWVCSGIPGCLRGMPDYFYRARALPCPWRHFGGVVATIADAAGRDLGSARASLSSTRAADWPGHGIHGSLAAVPPEGVARRRVRRRMTISNRAPCGSTRRSRFTWLVVGTFARTGPEVSHRTASPRRVYRLLQFRNAPRRSSWPGTGPRSES